MQVTTSRNARGHVLAGPKILAKNLFRKQLYMSQFHSVLSEQTERPVTSEKNSEQTSVKNPVSLFHSSTSDHMQ